MPIDLQSLSDAKIVSLFTIVEKTLDDSGKSKRIKSLLFKNISQQQCSELRLNNHRDEKILEYFSYVYGKVKFCLLCFVFVKVTDFRNTNTKMLF